MALLLSKVSLHEHLYIIFVFHEASLRQMDAIVGDGDESAFVEVADGFFVGFLGMVNTAKTILTHHRSLEANDMCMGVNEILELIPGTK